MAFWNTTKIKAECQANNLIEPYREERALRCAYELGVGPEAYITSKTEDSTQLGDGVKVTVPPGQFGLLTTREVIAVPNSAIAFISIRASIKFQGLVNVSGFHVDPGFHGRLKFAVYNAGSKDIVLDQDERVFMIWFADLNEDAPDPYGPGPAAPNVITSKDVGRLRGEVASPAELKKQVDEIKNDYEKRLQSVELTQKILQWLAGTLIVLILGTMLRAGWFDRAVELANRPGRPAKPARRRQLPRRRGPARPRQRCPTISGTTSSVPAASRPWVPSCPRLSRASGRSKPGSGRLAGLKPTSSSSAGR